MYRSLSAMARYKTQYRLGLFQVEELNLDFRHRTCRENTILDTHK